MTTDKVEAFRRTLPGAAPATASLALQALWWAGKGDWERAHGIAQQQEGDPACDLVHAHLHRQEGDLENARYWYGQAGRMLSEQTLPDEWTTIAGELLGPT